MSTSEFKGIALTPGVLSFILGLVVLFGATWGALTYLKDIEFKNLEQDREIARLETSGSKVATELDELNANVIKLNQQVVRLTVVLEGFSKQAMSLPSSIFLHSNETRVE